MSDPLDRLVARIEFEECWEWTGYRNRAGYGSVSVANRTRAVHRYVYESVVEEIPDGLQLDHLCGNPPCVNPDHLEPVTAAENRRREAERKTHCASGHPFSTHAVVNRKGHRICLTCRRRSRREASRRARARARAEARAEAQRVVDQALANLAEAGIEVEEVGP